MPKLIRKQVVFVKQETTQGTPATPGATDALLVEDFQYDPNFELVKRPFYRTSLDTLASMIGKRSVGVKFRSELKGSGTAGTAYTPFGACIQATGMTETASVGVSVTYAPTSSAASGNFYGPGKSITIEWYADGLKHIIFGAVGKKTLKSTAGGVVYYEFEFTGIYSEPTDTAAGTQTYNTLKPPLFMGVTFSVHSLSAVIETLSVEDGNTISERPSAAAATGILGFMITGREPVATIDPEVESIATHNWLNRVTSSTEGAMSLVVGGTAGNIITFNWPKAQYIGPKYDQRNGILVMKMQIQLNQNSGDDYETIVFT
jgi:hypothetical protein